jgi:hypothetical protein
MKLARRSYHRVVRPNANDFSVLNPTLWANEALLMLRERMGMARLVNQNYNSEVVDLGDVVNILVPGTFNFGRKGAPCESVVIQDMSATKIQVKMDQWPQVAFKICDGEPGQKRFDYITTMLTPAMDAFGAGINRILATQVYQFLANNAGKLNGLDETNLPTFLADATLAADDLNWPEQNRTIIIPNRMKRAGLLNQTFLNATEDDVRRRGALDMAMGWNMALQGHAPSIKATQATYTAAVNNAGGYAAGATSIAFDGMVGATTFAVGDWLVIAGDQTPQQVTVVGGGTNGTPITISPGLKRAVADNAVITVIKGGLVNKVGGYAGTSGSTIGYSKGIITDGWSSAPALGQGITFGTTTTIYSIIRIDVVTPGSAYVIWLDKPLAANIADDATIHPLPSGDYGFAFLSNAFTLVSRPPKLPGAGTGNNLGVAAVLKTDPITGLTIRVTISYNADVQATMCVIDTFMGVATVNDDLGLAVFG